MRTNIFLAISIALITCTLGTVSSAQAQTVTLTSSTWTGLTGAGIFFGPPIFAVGLTSSAAGSFGVPSLTAGSSTTVTFSPSKFTATVFNSGVAGTTATGSGTGSFSFNIAGGTGTVSIPLNYTVKDLSNGPVNGLAEVGITSTSAQFDVISGGVPRVFSFQINPKIGNVTEGAPNQPISPILGTLTFVGIGPEPGTAALVGIGIVGLVPIAPTIRRRRN